MWDCCCEASDLAPTVDINPEWSAYLAWISWWHPSLPWSAGLEMAGTQADDISSLLQDAYVEVYRKGCHCTQCSCWHLCQVICNCWKHTLLAEILHIKVTSYLFTFKWTYMLSIATCLHLCNVSIWCMMALMMFKLEPRNAFLWEVSIITQNHWDMVSYIDTVLVHWTVQSQFAMFHGMW